MEPIHAAVRTGPSTTTHRMFPRPIIPSDGALLKVEVAGICGTDVKVFAKPTISRPVIMGHENVGVIVEAGPQFVERQGFVEGDRVFVEHYVPCRKCDWCHLGEYRHCEATDWRTNPSARRYGYTTSDNPYHLWGGFAQYLYLPWNAVLHRIPADLSIELAGILTPLSNGIEWALVDGGVKYDSAVLIEGAGQQGLSQVVACKQVGAPLVIVTGTKRSKARLELALALGADHVIDISEGDTLQRIRDLTGGDGVDVVLDCTAGGGTDPVLLGIDALKRRAGVMVLQGEMEIFPDLPMKKLTEKAITIKSARGHSYRSCELAVDQVASGRFPLERLTTHTFGLEDVDQAIATVSGLGEAGAIHVSVLPWA